jgi:hypothetical protein
MTPSHRAASVLVVAALGLAPLAASAAAPAGVSVQHSKHPTPPDSGRWRVTGTDLAGAFRVARKHAAVSRFRGTIGPDAETACGTGRVTVVGTHKIIEMKGDSEFGRYNFWGVGKNDPNADPVNQPERVTVIQNGHHRKGRFSISFVGAKGHSKQGDAAGVIDYHGTNCELQFDVRKS